MLSGIEISRYFIAPFWWFLSLFCLCGYELVKSLKHSSLFLFLYSFLINCCFQSKEKVKSLHNLKVSSSSPSFHSICTFAFILKNACASYITI